MHRREREGREMAGWQCAAGRAILRMEARVFGPLAGTSKNTVLRFESGEFVPRPITVFKLEKALRDRGVYPTYDVRGEPAGLRIRFQAYHAAYPERREVRHYKRPDEVAKDQRKAALAGQLPFAGVKRQFREENNSPPINRQFAANSPPIDLASLEAQAALLGAELARLKRQEAAEDDDEFDF